MNKRYAKYLESKTNNGIYNGFEPIYIPDCLFDFQKALVDYAIQKGRCAIFADCGLGKSVMELVWAHNIVRKTNKRVLLITPIAVGGQMLQEAAKFSIPGVCRSRDGKLKDKIIITNYERLHYFNPSDFVGVVLDESSILKNFKGATKTKINIFLRKIKYRLLATATAAPNDFIELGTTSEALGYLGYMDMLSKFFKNDQNNCATNRRGRFTEATKWRLKGHAHDAFWKWVTSWSRSVKFPSDMGFSDNGFILPKLREKEHEIDITRKAIVNQLLVLPAKGLKEVREERKATIKERCEYVANIINKTKSYAVVWCNLNAEGDLLEKLIKDAIQISGRDKDDKKENKLISFSKGDERVLITKPKIGAWGLNWQHCHHVAFFPAYSYEQYYQAIRRCWRFGQKKSVVVELVYSKGDRNAIKNLRRKQKQADDMYANLVKEMNNSLAVSNNLNFNKKVDMPLFLG